MSDWQSLTPAERAERIARNRREHSSVFHETQAAIADARLEARAAAIEEAVGFLSLSGFAEAAAALDMAAFGRAQG